MKDNINVALLCGMIQKLTLKMSFRERKFLLILTLLFKKILNYFRSIYILSYFELFNIFSKTHTQNWRVLSFKFFFFSLPHKTNITNWQNEIEWSDSWHMVFSIIKNTRKYSNTYLILSAQERLMNLIFYNWIIKP